MSAEPSGVIWGPPCSCYGTAPHRHGWGNGTNWERPVDVPQPAAGPTGEGRAEAREHYPCCGLGPECHRYGLCVLERREAAERAELAALRALRQRVEHLADGYALMGTVLHSNVARETFAKVAVDLRRALAGRDGDGEKTPSDAPGAFRGSTDTDPGGSSRPSNAPTAGKGIPE